MPFFWVPDALQGRRPMLVWDIRVVKAQKEGKQPPESYSRAKKFGSFEHLKPMANRERTMLLTDGATCYPKMARETKVLHEWVAHNRGEFDKTVYRGAEKISCTDETIDAAWSAVKDFIPNSLFSKSTDLLLYVKCWQWRYVNLHNYPSAAKNISTLKSLL